MLEFVDEDMSWCIFKSWYGLYDEFGEVVDVLDF